MKTLNLKLRDRIAIIDITARWIPNYSLIYQFPLLHDKLNQHNGIENINM